MQDTFPVIAMWGQRCGLHITATTAIYNIINPTHPFSPLYVQIRTPEAVLTGLVFKMGRRTLL